MLRQALDYSARSMNKWTGEVVENCLGWKAKESKSSWAKL